MNEELLPLELSKLEGSLRARAGAMPPGDLKFRVLSAIGAERARQNRQSWWDFIAAAAAMLLLGMNLAATVGANGQTRPPSNDRPSLQAAADDLQKIEPQLSRREALREALLLKASARALPGGTPLRSLTTREPLSERI